MSLQTPQGVLAGGNRSETTARTTSALPAPGRFLVGMMSSRLCSTKNPETPQHLREVNFRKYLYLHVSVILTLNAERARNGQKPTNVTPTRAVSVGGGGGGSSSMSPLRGNSISSSTSATSLSPTSGVALSKSGDFNTNNNGSHNAEGGGGLSSGISWSSVFSPLKERFSGNAEVQQAQQPQQQGKREVKFQSAEEGGATNASSSFLGDIISKVRSTTVTSSSTLEASNINSNSKEMNHKLLQLGEEGKSKIRDAFGQQQGAASATTSSPLVMGSSNLSALPHSVSARDGVSNHRRRGVSTRVVVAPATPGSNKPLAAKPPAATTPLQTSSGSLLPASQNNSFAGIGHAAAAVSDHHVTTVKRTRALTTRVQRPTAAVVGSPTSDNLEIGQREHLRQWLKENAARTRTQVDDAHDDDTCSGFASPTAPKSANDLDFNPSGRRKARLVDFFTQYDPEKLHNVDSIIEVVEEQRVPELFLFAEVLGPMYNIPRPASLVGEEEDSATVAGSGGDAAEQRWASMLRSAITHGHQGNEATRNVAIDGGSVVTSCNTSHVKLKGLTESLGSQSGAGAAAHSARMPTSQQFYFNSGLYDLTHATMIIHQIREPVHDWLTWISSRDLKRKLGELSDDDGEDGFESTDSSNSDGSGKLPSISSSLAVRSFCHPAEFPLTLEEEEVEDSDFSSSVNSSTTAATTHHEGSDPTVAITDPNASRNTTDANSGNNNNSNNTTDAMRSLEADSRVLQPVVAMPSTYTNAATTLSSVEVAEATAVNRSIASGSSSCHVVGFLSLVGSESTLPSPTAAAQQLHGLQQAAQQQQQDDAAISQQPDSHVTTKAILLDLGDSDGDVEGPAGEGGPPSVSSSISI